MGVLNLQPHTIVYYDEEEGYEDEKGYYHEGTRTESGSIKCKAVPDSGRSNVVAFEDGTTAKVSFVCYYHDNKIFHFGERVKLILSNGVEKEYLVAGFIPYQLKSKVWLAI